MALVRQSFVASLTLTNQALTRHQTREIIKYNKSL